MTDNNVVICLHHQEDTDYLLLLWPVKRFTYLTYTTGSIKFTEASVPSQYGCAM